MRTIEVPTGRWDEFLKQLNRNVAHRPVRLEVENLELGDQMLAGPLPLEGLDLDENARSLEIMAGGDGRVLSHRIEQPNRLYALVDDEGNVACLSIEDASGGRTLMYFEQLPALPSTLQGGTEHQPAAPH